MSSKQDPGESPEQILEQEPPVSRRGMLPLAALLVVCTLYVFRQTYSMPYTADDWLFVHWSAFHSTTESIRHAFDASALLQFRPFQWLYALVVYKLLGGYTCGFHPLAIAIHCLSSLLVVYLVFKCLGSRFAAWTTGFLYAISVQIHVTQQIWMVGACDVFGAFFAFSSFALLINRRRSASAVALLVALLFKEAAISMLGIMACYSIYQTYREMGYRKAAWNALHELWPHILMVVIFMIPKMLYAKSPLSLPDNHPYKLKFFGPHILRNAVFYGVWTIQSILPIDLSHPRRLIRYLIGGTPGSMVIVGLILVVVALLVVAAFKRPRGRAKSGPSAAPRLVFLAAWAVIGIAPVYFLPNHVFPYYLTYSLPACIALLLVIAKGVAKWYGLSGVHIKLVALVGMVLCLVNSSLYIDRAIADHNGLLVAARQVGALHGYLVNELHAVPPGTIFVLDGADIIYGVRGGMAMQVWYRDPSIRAFDLSRVRRDPNGFYVAIDPASEENNDTVPGRLTTRIAPEKTICLRIAPGFAVTRFDLDRVPVAPR